jgi:hypothetical protein
VQQHSIAWWASGACGLSYEFARSKMFISVINQYRTGPYVNYDTLMASGYFG